MTWPMLSALLAKMKKFPPVDMVAAGWMKSQQPKSIGEAAASSGMPMKKGKVKRRGDLSR